MINLGAGRETVESEVSQVVRITRHDVNEKIVAASHVENAPHLWERDHVVAERVDNIPRVLAQTHRDHRFEPDTNRRGVDVGVGATQHPDSFETSHPFETGRGSDTYGFRKTIVGNASILLQNTHDGEVDSVELV
jgi:hypothetical protein